MRKWTFKTGKHMNGYYELNGWKIWSNGFGWMIKNPKGHVYAVEYKQLATAKRFAEKRMK